MDRLNLVRARSQADLGLRGKVWLEIWGAPGTETEMRLHVKWERETASAGTCGTPSAVLRCSAGQAFCHGGKPDE